jgi:hypothetical protein
MASAPAKDVGPPVTPAQLKRLRDEGAPKPPDAPKKPDAPPAPKVMPQKRVRCFEPNDLPPSKYAEFDRQLDGQERGLNEMTVDEYLKGREAFEKGNAARSLDVARKARADYEAKVASELAEQLRESGLSSRKAEAQAAKLASERMKTLAALHNPDMKSGGKDVISDFGDKNVNSRIGAQWRSRIGDLDEAASRVPAQERQGTKMNAKLQRCP